MKKLYVLSLIVAFVFLGAQAMASPPVPPPPEGFIISTDTDISCEGSVTETENFSWVYFAGNGNISAVTSGTDAWGHPIITQQGFNAGAQIAYQQSFQATEGKTVFIKSFDATSHETPNLVVSKQIDFEPAAGSTAALATHTEKVGISIVSAGQQAGVSSIAAGLLSLCPWAQQTTTTNPGYPATNEGIAAGSSFEVTKIDNFTSATEATTTALPTLSYVVKAPDGEGTISAGFVVELWEGKTGWGQHDIGTHNAPPNTVGTLAQDPIPLVAGRTSYAEHASATGTWSFNKSMFYQSVMPGASTVSPIANVP